MNSARLFVPFVLVGAALVAMPVSARAEQAEPTRVLVGGQLELVPTGSVHAEIGDDTLDFDTDPAVALTGQLGLALGPNFALTFAPRLMLGIKGEDDTESAKQLDLAVRLIGRAPVAPAVELRGFVAPGYSIMFMPDWPEGVHDPKGFAIGFGGGAAFRVAPQLAVTAEIGYSLGFHTVSADGTDETGDLNTQFLHFAAGLEARL